MTRYTDISNDSYKNKVVLFTLLILSLLKDYFYLVKIYTLAQIIGAKITKLKL
jgi:hypothetical protein